ncbi:MAG: class I SAM-dependent methyltransferase [Deltaproteobacteria bacterium]|jgi:SAM-dependent methyltransferase|nr:class I SAM-dependent methyltransferase [Deltaproteobacteria bacterium]
MAYQSFPWQQGDSRSFEKLVGLYLPALRGKTFLDVGCNTGYFCGWAAFQGAAKVRGIDASPVFVSQAVELFPECSFACMSWDDLGPEKFDVILCISALHYAKDQQKLIALLMDRLAPGGLLVLEIGIAPGEEDAFVEVQRSIDTRLFPTRKKVASMLVPYVSKELGQSIRQGGDPLPRFIYHVTHARPYAVTFLDGHYAGKTSTIAALLRPEIRRVSGDVIYSKIVTGALAVSDPLREKVTYVPGTTHIDSVIVTRNICEQGLLPDLLAVFQGAAEGKDFILDHFIPLAYRPDVHAILHASGYFVVDASLFEAAHQPWTRKRLPFKQYEAYTRCLEQRYAINEADYLAANPDVAIAVAEGRMPSGQYHYMHFGKKEKRKLRPA